MSKTEVPRLKWFLDKAKDKSPEGFLTSFPSPVLIVMGGLVTKESGFDTRTAASFDSADLLRRLPAFDPNARVLVIEKRPSANHYADKIFLGRAPNSDIHLQTREISKMHAYFVWDDLPEGKKCKFADGCSTNGSWINQVKMTPHTPYEVQDGDILGLGGSVFLRFYGPKGFLAVLSAINERGQGS